MELTQVFFGRILICFASGIFLGYLFPLNPRYLILLLLSCGISFLLYVLNYLISRNFTRYTFRYIRGIQAYTFLLVLGFSLYQVRSTNFEPNHFSKSAFTTFKGSLTESMKLGTNSSHGVFEIEQIQTKNGWKKTGGKIVIYLKGKTLYPVGTVLTINKEPTKTKAPLNPYQFDYAGYLDKKYITHALFINQGDITEVQQTKNFCLNSVFEPIRIKIKKLFHLNIPNRNSSALVLGLLLGDKSEMDQEIKLRYNQVGLAHILAVSGFHTALIYQILYYVFWIVRRIRGGKYFHIAFVLSGLWFYALLTGLSPSVTRAATMLSLLLLTQLLKREPNNIHILSLAACCILLINPNTLFDLGFQLSFCAVLGIFTLNKSLKNLFVTDHKILKPIWETICISTSAQLFTIPIILYYFHQFPLYFIISNLFTLLPVIGLIYLSILLIAFSWVEYIANILGIIIKVVTQAMEWIVTFIATLPTFTDQIYIHSVQALLVLFAILCLAHGFDKKKVNWIYSSYIFIIAFWGVQHTSYFLASRQKEIAVFHVNKHSIVALLNGRNIWVYSDISKPHESPVIRQACIDYLGTKRVKYITYQNLSGNTLIEAWGKRICINNGKDKTLKADYQIMHQCGRNTEFNEQQFFEKVIIDGSNKIPKIKTTTCYNTSISGAFIEHF